MNRYPQAFQRQHPLAWPCAMAGLTTAALAHPEADGASPLPLFLAQTLAYRARKAWGAGGLGPRDMEQAAGLMLRYSAQSQSRSSQQVATQLGLAVCAAVLACPRIDAHAVFGEAMGLVECAMAAAALGAAEAASAGEAARLRLLQLLPEEALRGRSLSVPMDRRRAVVKALAGAGEASGATAPPPPPAAQVKQTQALFVRKKGDRTSQKKLFSITVHTHTHHNQALHHLIALRRPALPPLPAFAAMAAWLGILDASPSAWDAVLSPWLPQALEVARAAVGRREGEEAEAVAAAALDLLACMWMDVVRGQSYLKN